jgi:ABC-2 type transport system ATP-binding protein
MSGPSSTPTDEAHPAVARGLAKTYRDGTVGLAGVDLTLAAGELVALAGGNGSGKTTLLRLLAGGIAPSAGELSLFGLPPGHSLVRPRVSYVSQEQALDPEMTSLETLRLFGALHGMAREAVAARIRVLAEELELASYLRRRTSTLSGGMRQRLHLALGLIPSPRLVLLDEPTSALDPHGRAAIWDQLRALAASGCTVLVATHDLGEIERHAARVLLLARGTLAADGTPAALRAAHGRARLVAELAPGAGPGGELLDCLERIPGVVTVRYLEARRSLTVRAAPGPALDDALRRLEGAGLPIAAYARYAPDLSDVFTALAGSPPAGAPEPGRGARCGQGRGRGARRGVSA